MLFRHRRRRRVHFVDVWLAGSCRMRVNRLVVSLVGGVVAGTDGDGAVVTWATDTRGRRAAALRNEGYKAGLC